MGYSSFALYLKQNKHFKFVKAFKNSKQLLAWKTHKLDKQDFEIFRTVKNK